MGFSSGTSLSEAWSQYNRQFSTAEYAIKVCEHLSAELSESAVISLSTSGEYAVAALRQQSEDSASAIKSLEKAYDLTRKATKEVLCQGLLLLADRVGSIRIKYGEDTHDLLAKHIENFNEHEGDLSRLTGLIKDIEEGKATKKRNFIEQSQEIIRRIVNFMDEYTIKAEVINADYGQMKKNRWAHTWGKLIAAIAGLAVAYLLDVVVNLIILSMCSR